jgi:formylglycine-generating enzyme required for sulfatase activity
MVKNPSHFQAGAGGAAAVKGLDTKRFPVECVSWDDAEAFCKKMRACTKPARTFRLPTEAEWEYACRAGTRTPFYFGSKLNGNQANCDGNHPYGTIDQGPFKERTTKVGDYGTNPWGLCDMHGNVWQWCADYYDAKYYANSPMKDPFNSKKPASDRRVLRGGSWYFSPALCRAAFRFRFAPDYRFNYIGFRVCLPLD